MKVLSMLTLALGIFFGSVALGQPTDTLINVGNYQLHFNVTPGVGIPIIFESGAGNDGSVWNEVCKRLRQHIGSPLVTYDRAGFGASGIDNNQIDITSEVNDLQICLKQLKFDGAYFLVAHSLRELRHEIHFQCPG
ncbi:alpha/beta fold hydrolase [Parapedobacter deserti]|uniref:Alpha/beta fold hydrolase n=1 Tax=Parapedobacter deserti TaxID=1912957 RepID=A0ABV7JTV8_9SPHI